MGNTNENFDLSQSAVGRASGEDAGTVLGALLETPGIGLVHEYTVAKAPTAPVAVPSGPGLGGGSKPAAAARGGQTAAVSSNTASGMSEQLVPEYEVFQNDNNAVAFFLNRQASADLAGDNGPYWFMVHEGKNIVAGSESGQAFFADVAEDVIKIARERGVILLIEFENQSPIRCTPCYYMDQDDLIT